MVKKEAKKIALEEIIYKIEYMEISEYTQDRLSESEFKKVNKEIENILNNLIKKLEKMENMD